VLATLREQNSTLHFVNPYYERLYESSPTDIRTPYYQRVAEARQALSDLERDLADPPRELQALLALQRRLVLTQVRLSLASLWQASLLLEGNLFYPHDLGWDSDKTRWRTSFHALRAAWAQAFADPDFSTLPGLFEQWKNELEDVNIVVLVVTTRIGGALGGSTTLTAGEITFVEAAVLTAGSTLGRLAIGRSIDPGEVLTDLVDNVLMLGAFKLLDAVVVTGARMVFGPGRIIAEFAVVVGTNVVVSTALPLVVARIKNHEWPEDTWLVVAGGLLVNAVAIGLATPALLRRLEGTALVAELQALRAEGHVWSEQMRAVGEEGQLSQQSFRALQKRGSDVARRGAAVMRRLAEINPGQLRGAAAKAAREELLGRAKTMADFAGLIDGIVYTGPQRRLPPPGDVSTSLVRTGPRSFGYDPAHESSTALTRRFSGRGYEATDLGGGVLRLTSGEVTWDVLPLPRETLALPPGGLPGEAELVVTSAVGRLVEGAARQAVGPERWKALVSAADVDPELVRRALQATDAQLTQRLSALAEALTAVGTDRTTVQRVTEAVQQLNAARRATLAPASVVLDVLGPGAAEAGLAVLATPDGQAVLAAAARDRAAVRNAIQAADMVAEPMANYLALSLRGSGVGDDEVASVLEGVAALRQVLAVTTADPGRVLVDAAGGQASAAALVANAQYSAAGKSALAAVGREPLLARRAVLAETPEGLARALDALVAAAAPALPRVEDVSALRELLTGLNDVARTAGAKERAALVAAEVREGLLDQEDFTAVAGEVIRFRFKSGRARREAWLATPNRAVDEVYALHRAVQDDPHLLELARDAGGRRMLKELWVRFRAPRAKALKSKSFARYVRILEGHHRGLFREYDVAFRASDDFILLKAPDQLVTVPGPDIWLVPRGGGDILVVDVKDLAADQVEAVDALTRNLPKGLAKDVAVFDELLQRGAPDVPAELLDAIDRVTKANAEIQQIVKRKSKRVIAGQPMQKRIEAILRKHGIRRVVASHGTVSKELRDAGIESRDFDLQGEIEE
jgi:hypothetical protein